MKRAAGEASEYLVVRVRDVVFIDRVGIIWVWRAGIAIG